MTLADASAISSRNITSTSSNVEKQSFWLPFRPFCVSARMRPASSSTCRFDETVDCGSLRPSAMSLTLTPMPRCRSFRIWTRSGEASPRKTSGRSSGSMTRKLRAIRLSIPSGRETKLGLYQILGYVCVAKCSGFSTQEHEAAVSLPEELGMPIVAVEPQPVVDVDREDEAIAVRAGDGLHCDSEPFSARLVLVDEPQGGTDFGRAGLQTQLERFGADVLVVRTVVEAEFLDGRRHEVNLGPLLCAGG